MELDLARDAGVYENQPEVRNDVIRADEYEPEVIPVARTRSTRAMWSRREAETDDADSRKAPPAVKLKFISEVHGLQRHLVAFKFIEN